ncbi:MAG: ABC transporter ATP-binding protein [Gammaproteobacteria bacterium]|nr:ABC transporter ATP-binding protein [Gammaproteobacteria bacterium]
MLKINNVEVIYNDVILVLKGVNMTMEEGSCIALLGANGAGKTTTLAAISGIIKSEDGKVTSGSIEFDGQRVDNQSVESNVARGLIHVMEGRKVLQHMTVEKNLIVGGHVLKSGAEVKQRIENVYTLIPRLAELRKRTAGYLSGGEQQMLVIGRALMANPRLILIDEPSLGLAPLMVEEVFKILKELRKSGISLFIVEQNTQAALEVADYGYVMENGRIVMDGEADQLMKNEDVREFYLGLNMEGERKSYRDVKHYKRRKRWLG